VKRGKSLKNKPVSVKSKEKSNPEQKQSREADHMFFFILRKLIYPKKQHLRKAKQAPKN